MCPGSSSTACTTTNSRPWRRQTCCRPRARDRDGATLGACSGTEATSRAFGCCIHGAGSPCMDNGANVNRFAMSGKWKQVVFVVFTIFGAYLFNRQRVSFYTFEPPLDERIPCAAVPSMMERREDCEAAVCLWKEAEAPYPRCFQPRDYYGYRLLGYSAQDFDHVVFNLTYAGGPYSPHSDGLIPNVQFEMIKYSNRIVRFRFVNAAEKRYEVPVQDTFEFLRKPRYVYNPRYSFKMGSSSRGGYFQFSFMRRHTDVKLIDTSIGGLVMTDQYLQFVTYLPSTNLYGFGETLHKRLRHEFDFSTHVMFARDQVLKDGKNLYGVHPFYMCVEDGGKAHGVLLLNSNAIEYTLLKAPALRLATIGGVLDFFLFVGDNPTQVIELYASVIGKPFLPPYWALGFQLSRYGYGSLEKLRKVLERNQKAGFPVDVQHLDIDYMENSTTFTVDPVRYAGLVGFMAEQREKNGLRFVVNLLWPCSPVAFVDFFKNSTALWWKGELAELQKKLPFDGIWLDMNEPAEFSTNRGALSAAVRKKCFKDWKLECHVTIFDDPPYPTRAATQYGPEARLSDRTLCMSGRLGDTETYWHYDVHNLYGWSEMRATHSALDEVLGERQVIISRSTYPSSGRYGGHWLGDNQSTWTHLRRSIIGMLEFNMFGIPYVGADICGFVGNVTEDLCVRWMQLGAFYPFSRSHNDIRAVDQDPAVFSEAAQAVMRKALQVRYTLMPYLYTLFYEAHNNGTPVVRPLFFEFPHEPHTYGIDAQFMWGKSLLISPITRNNTYMSFYLPAGLWYEYYDNTPFLSSGEYMVHNWLTLKTPTPLYVRAGSVLPTQTPGLNTHDRLNKTVTLMVYPHNGKASGTLFWDDGVGKRNIETGAYDYIRFRIAACHMTISRLHKNTAPVPLIIGSIVMVGQETPPTHLYVDEKQQRSSIALTGNKVYEFKVQLSLHLDNAEHSVEWEGEGNRCVT
ncbi:maltase-glucoamylase-like isoform X3 [Dermacentor silvarum]|uniref:maltase-glucoamylase-like isoform X3 n=1 Tax=Dermacentor silvarum TaxID=543639 RepID=UPI0021017A85|nr:maltase-glucoamylase-like isoform X3 [Dermacentor silvarum]